MIAKLRDNRYWIHGTVGKKFLRLPLGTSNKDAANVTVDHIERALSEGQTSLRWPELKKILPPKTFAALAKIGNYSEPEPVIEATVNTWHDLCEVNELDMERQIANKDRGATREEGIMSASTRDRYQQTIRQFTAFLADKNIPLNSIDSSMIEKFKVDRHKKITP